MTAYVKGILISLIITSNMLSINTPVEVESRETMIPILMYHHFVEDEIVENPSEIMSIDLFENQMAYLKEKGFNTISLSQLRDYLYYDEKLPYNPIVITMDDGYESNYTLAYPVLKKYNMKANINIIVSYRDVKPGIFRHFSWEQARDMVGSGLIEIGSHTYNLHNAGIMLQNDDGEDEYYTKVHNDFKLSKNEIMKNLGYEPFIFCYPYGIYNDLSQKAASSLDFNIHLSTDKGVVTKNSNPFALERINVRGDQSPEELYETIINTMDK